MKTVSRRRLLFLWRVLNEEAHCRLQSYSPVMNRAERDYFAAVQALWIVEDALGKERDTTWPCSMEIKSK